MDTKAAGIKHFSDWLTECIDRSKRGTPDKRLEFLELLWDVLECHLFNGDNIDDETDEAFTNRIMEILSGLDKSEGIV